MKRIIFSLSLLLLISIDSKSQETKNGKSEVSTASKQATFSPGGSGGITNMLSNFNLSSTYNDGANGKVELVHTDKKFFTWSGYVDQKIGKNSKEATPIDLNGVSPGTTVGFGVQYFIWNPNTISDGDAEKITEIKKEYAAKKGIADFRTVTNQEIYNNGNASFRRKINKYLVSKHTPLYFSINGGFTKTSFSYSTDSLRFTEEKKSFISPTLNVSITKAFGNGLKLMGYVSFKYTYSESYTAADDMNFTMPFGTTGNFYGKTLAFGKPEKSTTNNFSLEYRRNFYAAKDKNIFAIAPSATFAVDRKLFSLQVPFYFIQGRDDKGKLLNNLQSGIKLGYITSTEGNMTSFKDGFTAQLVISEPLSALMP